MSEDGNTTNRVQDLPGPPDSYVRRTTLLQTLGACVGVFGAIIGFYGFLDRLRDALATEIRNERIERINAQVRTDERIDACCSRRGR